MINPDDVPVIDGYWNLLPDPLDVPIRSKCHYCGAALRKANRSWDHVIPLGRGGHDRAWNRVPACQPCNRSKGMSWPDCACGWCQRALAIHAQLGDFPYQ
jgi:5-methylcytosine-specific restriction endonuclease McrA